MSHEKLTADDLAILRRGTEVWQAAQLRAGFAANDIVGVWPRSTGDDDAPSWQGSLADVDGILAAYLNALPQLDGDGFSEIDDWRDNAGAIVAVIQVDGRRAGAVLTLDSSDRSSEQRLNGYFELKVSPETGGLICEGGDDGTFDPLIFEPRPGTGESYRRDIRLALDLAGLCALFKLAGGECWVTRVPLENRESATTVSRIGVLAHPLMSGSDEERVLKGLGEDEHGSAFRLGSISLAHLRCLAESRAPGSTASAAVGPLAMNLPRIMEAARKLKTCGGSFSLLFKLPGFSTDGQLKFIVPGYVPAGMPTLFIGAAAAGKSTALHDLGILVATPKIRRESARTWLGVPASDIAYGSVILLSGEDSDSIIMERRRLLEGGQVSQSQIIEWPSNGLDLTRTLADLSGVRDIALLIVDPARKFLNGSEDDSGDVNSFFEELERFSTERQCAVIVAHHLKRNAKPVTPLAALEKVRGSQVFMDRPRAIIALVRRLGGISAAVVKSNMPPTFAMRERTERFSLDDATLRLLPLPEAADDQALDHMSANDEQSGHENVPLVVAAVRRAVADGVTVTRTGKRGIFESRLPGLAGRSRPKLRAATTAAIAAGALRVGAGGALTVADFGPLPALPAPVLALPATAAAAL